MGVISLNACVNTSIGSYNPVGDFQDLQRAVQDGDSFKGLTSITGELSGYTAGWGRSGVSVRQLTGACVVANAHEVNGVQVPIVDTNFAYGLNGESPVTFPATSYARMAHAIIADNDTVRVYELGVIKFTISINVGWFGYFPATRIVDTGAAIQYDYFNPTTGLWVTSYTSATYAPPVGGWRIDLNLKRSGQSGAVVWKSGTP
jgi:hypothetical protein